MALNVPVHRKKSRFYLAMSLVALAVVLVGFWTTFVLPSFRGEFSGGAIVYVHGASLFVWTLMLVVQSWLIQARKVRVHMTLGWVALAAAAAVVISTPAVGVYAMKRDLAAGQGQIAITSLLGNFTTPLVFAIFVALAIKYRRRPEPHKRLMLLAMLAILWPAFFRFRHYFPSIPSPEIYFGVFFPDLLVVVAILWDKLRNAKIHPAFLYGGTALIIENTTEALLFDTPPWQTAAGWLAGFFL